MTNLLEAIRAVEAQIRKREIEHETEMNELRAALRALVGLNEVCYRCGGCKKVDHRATAECDVETITCPDCKGSGRCDNRIGSLSGK